MEIQEALKHNYQIVFDNLAAAGDGGTICFELIDSDNERHTLFIDKRMESETMNHLYAHRYPSAPDAVHLGMNEQLLKTIEKNR